MSLCRCGASDNATQFHPPQSRTLGEIEKCLMNTKMNASE